MKIRIKLIAAMILIIFLPLTAMTLFSTSKYTEMIEQTQTSALKLNNANKAAYINESLRNLLSDIRAFSADENVRKFAELSGCEEELTEEQSAQLNECMEHTVSEIKRISKKAPSISEMYVIDKEGMVLADSDQSRIGSIDPDKDELYAFASKNNGISRIYPPISGNGNYFYIVRRIYSSDNKSCALVCQKIQLDEMCSMLELTGYSDNAVMMMIDSEGKYITNEVSMPKALDSVVEYRGIGEHLRPVIPYYGEANYGETMTAEYDNYTVFGNAVNTGGWSIVSFYDSKEAKSDIKTQFSGVTLFYIVMAALSIAAMIFILIRFTYPINELIRVLNKINHGDVDERLDFSSNDEFGELSNSFNTIFDNINDSNMRYSTVVSMMDNIVFEINLKNYTVYVSNNFNKKFSFRAKDNSYRESFIEKMKVHKDDAQRFKADVNNFVSLSGEKWDGEYRLKNIYGDFSWIRIQGKKFYDSRHNPTKIIGLLADIDREKRSAINLQQKANFDALTQLHNRASFMRTLEEEMHSSVSRRSLDALMFIDLDDFKHFNDEYGHKCGDEVLKFVADTIKELTFDKGFGGRLGGDEFVMCLTNLKLIDDAGKVAAEMISILDKGFISESVGEHFNIHCSIGIAFFRENGGNSAELLESADTAMYRIKKSGKSNYAYAGKEQGEML